MTIATVGNFIQALRQLRLLAPAQLEEANRLQGRFKDPRMLGAELVRRGILSAYQVNQTLLGKGNDLVLGSYILLDKLGEGGMGEVFKARHQSLDRLVAIKIIRKEFVAKPEALRRFHREIQMAAQLHHPNVVLALDATRVGDTQLFVMEYVDGIDFGRLVKQRGRLPIREACEYIRQAAMGLQHAFERGLVHRDIKPGNLLLTGDGVKAGRYPVKPVIKLLDLGLARLADKDSNVTTLTQMGTMVGTPDFIAPEQARDSHKVDVRADLYSLGCTFYFILAAQVPYPGGALPEKLVKHFMHPPPEITNVRPEVPPAVAAILRKLLAKKPEDRFQTPVELAQALEVVLGQRKASPAVKNGWFSRPAAKPSASAPKAEEGRFFRVPVLLIVLFLLILGGGIAFLAWNWSGKEEPAGPGQPNGFQAQSAWEHSPLDKLDAGSIPQAERFAWQPKELVAILGEHRGRHYGMAVRSAAFSPDGQTIASASLDGTIRLWDASNLREKQVLRGPGTSAVSLAYSPKQNLLAASDENGTIRLWDLGTSAAPPREFKGHEGTIWSLAFSPDGQTLASAGNDETVRLWDLTGKEKTAPLKMHKGPVLSVVFSPSGKLLVSGGADHQVTFWDLGSSPPKGRAFGGHDQAVGSLAFSRDGNLLVSGSTDGMIGFWTLPATTLTQRLTVNAQAAVLALTFSPDGKFLLCGTSDGTLARIKPTEKDAARMIVDTNKEGAGISALAADPKGPLVVSGSVNGVVRLWDTSGGNFQERQASAGHKGAVNSVAFRPDCQALASGSNDGTVILWDLTDKKPSEYKTLSGQLQGVSMLAYSPDGKRIACIGNADPTVRMWDASGENPTEFFAFFGPKAAGGSLAFAPGNQMLAVGGFQRNRGRLALWNLAATPKREITCKGHGERVVSAAFAPDGKTLASSGGSDRTVRLWEAGSGKELKVWQGPGRAVGPVAFAPDSARVAIGGDGVVAIWETAKDKPTLLSASQPLAGMIQGVAFSADGRTLAAVGDDGKLILWDVQSGKETKQWTLGGRASSVAFAADGKHLAVGNANGTVYILRLAPGKPGG